MKTNKEEIFLKIPQLLINASGYVNNSGDVVKLNLSDKLVYAYMKSRFDFFMSLGKEYYDTQQSVADYCNMDLKTCGVILRKFEDNGVISIVKKPQGNFLKNIYTYVDRMKLCGGRGAFEVVIKEKQCVVDKPVEINYPEDHNVTDNYLIRRKLWQKYF